ncbi:MAG: bifunctional [glutamine synthetase] adenylyltransferase/[glutamine synthetase]-adenylyl-L-tyrosine phosphorylase [Rhodoluna sp.]
MAYVERPSGLSEFARYGFSDLSGTIGKLDQLVALVGDSGRSAVASLALAPDPDQALNGLLDFAERDKSVVKKLLQKPESANRFCAVLGASKALTDFLRRHPEVLGIFEKQHSVDLGPEHYRRVIVEAVEPILGPGFEASSAWNLLRKSYRCELLKIAIYDLTSSNPQEDLPIVAAALADIAGGAIEAGLAIARAELRYTKDHGAFTDLEIDATRLTVMAMGKCGARELNYISDVDVIYVAESASSDLETHRAIEVATKLATRMMRAMDATSAEPDLWQVDPNLRPEGKSGALVRTLDSHVAYYDRWAESWEFQALLKARPIAGDLELGDAYLAALSPKVWASAARENFVESAQKMRERVMQFIPANELNLEIKLGPGGLRDIEFTVQLLQLVHGRTDVNIHQRDTLSALEALTSGGYVGRNESAKFAKAYKFLRFLEHRIQLSDMRRTHLMPTSEAKLRPLARSVSTKTTSEQLLEDWERLKVEVRALHQMIFYRPLLSAVARLDGDNLELSSSQVEDRLHAIGFKDASGAHKNIAALTSGLSRRAAIQKQLLPVLLEWFAKGTDPDSALLAFRRLSEDLGESPWYLRMLRDATGAAERMTQVLSNSRLATSLFERIPEAAAWFERLDDLVPMTEAELKNEFNAIVSRHEHGDTAASSMRQIRRRETLRLAMGAVLGELTMPQISQGLSDLTACYVRGMLDVVVELEGSSVFADKPLEILDFGIISMGRFGGEELGFGSDADVMFVYEALPGVIPELAQKTAERIIADLKKLAEDHLLEFQLDLDLRPEGKKGPNARSLDSYRAYYARWADTWESQALLRAKPIAGSAKLREAFLELINTYRYPRELPETAVMEIRRIKARMETERLPQGADPRRHTKLGRGSLSDVEWLVQLMQLQFGKDHPSIRTPKTLAALEACVTEGLIAEHDARVLAEAWTFASRVRSASVLWANKNTDVLPTDRQQLEGMARIMEYPAGSATQLEEDYLAFTRRSRMVYERLFFA